MSQEQYTINQIPLEAPKKQQTFLFDDQNFPSLGSAQPIRQASCPGYAYRQKNLEPQEKSTLPAQGFAPKPVFVPIESIPPVQSPLLKLRVINLAGQSVSPSQFKPSAGVQPQSEIEEAGQFESLVGSNSIIEIWEKVNEEDPCKGKKKEFFIYDLDPVCNEITCTEE